MIFRRINNMGLFSRKPKSGEYDTEGSYRENGRVYLPQNKGWYTCVKCGKKLRWKDVDVDHIQPKSKGGSNDAYNLQVMCKHCNRSKGASTADTGKDLKRRGRQIDKDLEREKSRMIRDAKRDDPDAFKRTKIDKKAMDKAINGSDKDFDDYINSL